MIEKYYIGRQQHPKAEAAAFDRVVDQSDEEMDKNDDMLQKQMI